MMDEKVVVTFAIAFTLPLLALYFKWATGKGVSGYVIDRSLVNSPITPSSMPSQRLDHPYPA